MSVCWRRRRSSSMPSMRGILMSRIARSDRLLAQRLERGGPVAIGAHLVAFRLQRHAERGEDVALVVDQSDRAFLFHVLASLDRAAKPWLYGLAVRQIVAYLRLGYCDRNGPMPRNMHLDPIAWPMKAAVRPARHQQPPSAATGIAPALMRTALKASLATLDRATGHPYASLILVATEPDGAPIFLISRLASAYAQSRGGPARQPAVRRHRRPGRSPDRRRADADGRGTAERQPDGAAPLPGPASERRGLCRLRGFLGLYPSRSRAAIYIGGFGRIVDLPPAALLTDTPSRARWSIAEPDIVAAYEQRSCRRGRALCNRAARRPGGGLADERHRSRGMRLCMHNAARIGFPSARARR